MPYKMLKYFKIVFALFLLSLSSFNCERDLPSSYNYGRTESINLVSPAGGERFNYDQPVKVEWTSENVEDSLRIELYNNSQPMYSINNVPNSGDYIFHIPLEIVPAKKYQLKIESMVNPEISDINSAYFEITPQIDGHWSYSNLSENSGLEIALDLSSFTENAFLGNGTFHFKYISQGIPVDYLREDTVGGVMTYPDISFVMKEPGNKRFNFSGKMISNGMISGRISGFIDNTYGNLSDTLILVRGNGHL